MVLVRLSRKLRIHKVNKDEQPFGGKEILKLTAPQFGFLLLWATLMGGLLSFNSCSTGQQQSTDLDQKIQSLEQEHKKLTEESLKVGASEEIKKLKLIQLQRIEVQLKSQKEKLEKIDINKEALKAQLDEMKSANSKLSDLVIATLGTVVTIAFAVPALTVISQVIANQETIDKIQAKVDKNLDNALTDVDQRLENALNKFNAEISENLFINFNNDIEASYQIFNLSINKEIDKFRDILEHKLKSQKVQNVSLDRNGSLNWIKNLSEVQLQHLDKDDFKKLQIYRYPLLLQDCIKVLEILNNLKSSDNLDHNLLSIRIKRHLKVVQLPLIIIKESQLILQQLYVAPKPQSFQIRALENIIKEFKDDYEAEVTKINQLLKDVENTSMFPE